MCQKRHNMNKTFELTGVYYQQICILTKTKNRGILLKGTTRKFSSQEGGFLNFPRQLMTTALPKRFSTIKINSSSVRNICSYSKEILGSGMSALII